MEAFQTEQEIFKAGVRPGSPATNDEIKILICYILSNVKKSMSFAQLHECLSQDELVNYFELVAAVEALVRSGHIIASDNGGEDSYSVTATGETAAETVNGLLSVSVRDKAIKSADLLLRRQKRSAEVFTEITPSGTGFELKLALPGTDENLVSFAVFCPTKESAAQMRKRFLNDPVYIYKGVMALLAGDMDVIGEMFPSKEQLF